MRSWRSATKPRTGSCWRSTLCCCQSAGASSSRYASPSSKCAAASRSQKQALAAPAQPASALHLRPGLKTLAGRVVGEAASPHPRGRAPSKVSLTSPASAAQPSQQTENHQQPVLQLRLPASLLLCRPQVIQAFVRQAMSYLDATPDKETQVSLIKTLQTVTEGKVCDVMRGTALRRQRLRCIHSRASFQPRGASSGCACWCCCYRHCNTGTAPALL